MRNVAYPALTLLVLLIIGCGDSTSTSDASINDGSASDITTADTAVSDTAGDSSADAASDASATDLGAQDALPDFNPQNELLLTIPAGLKLCSGFAEARSWQEELALFGELDLAPGHLILPRTPSTTSGGAVIAGGRFFEPAKTISVNGNATREVSMLPPGPGFEVWKFLYRHTGLSNGTPIEIDLEISLISLGGAAYPATAGIADADTANFGITASGMLRMGAGQGVNELQWFSLCEHPGYQPSHTYQGKMQSNPQNTVLVEVVNGGACLISGNTTCKFVRRGEVTLDGESRTVTDRSKIMYSSSHHNENDGYLIVLDPPIGSTHAVVIERSFFAPSSNKLLRLDAAWNTLSESTLVDP